MDRVKKIVKHRTVRFGLVGVGNTLLNFAILNFAFYALGTGKIIASVIATICAATLSFFLNRGFVFRHTGRSIRQPVMFAVVTLTGVLMVQNGVYALFVHLFQHHTTWMANLVNSVIGKRFSDDFFEINMSNVIASLVAMFWNYNGYRLFVFKDKTSHEEPASTT